MLYVLDQLAWKLLEVASSFAHKTLRHEQIQSSTVLTVTAKGHNKPCHLQPELHDSIPVASRLLQRAWRQSSVVQ